MQRANNPSSPPHPKKRYEEYAYVLDFTPHGRSKTVSGREGVIVTAVGEDRLMLLEILATANSTFGVGEQIYIGQEGRTKVESVLGRMRYKDVSQQAQTELATVVECIVAANEKRFVEYLNNARPLTHRVHALELIPGIGKTYMRSMLEERERKRFDSYEDLEERVGFKEPIRHITERIVDEITGQSRMNIFVKRW